MPKPKECFKCGVVKPARDFYRHPMMADGRLGKCKECQKRDVALNTRKRRKNPEWVAKERARCVEKQVRYGPLYRARFPGKARARWRLSNAVQRGHIKKPDRCQSCSKKCNPDGHHTDYSRPLDVMWLCRRCHLAEHGRLRKVDNTF